MTDKIEVNVTAPVLARLLGVSGNAIYDLAQAVVIGRAASALYALELSGSVTANGPESGIVIAGACLNALCGRLRNAEQA